MRGQWRESKRQQRWARKARWSPAGDINNCAHRMTTQCWSSSWLLLRTATLCSQADSLHSCRMQFWMSDLTFYKVFLNIHWRGVLAVLFGCYMAGATSNCCCLGAFTYGLSCWCKTGLPVGLRACHERAFGWCFIHLLMNRVCITPLGLAWDTVDGKWNVCDACTPGERWAAAVEGVWQSAVVGGVPWQRSARVLPLWVLRRLPSGQVSPYFSWHPLSGVCHQENVLIENSCCCFYVLIEEQKRLFDYINYMGWLG